MKQKYSGNCHLCKGRIAEDDKKADILVSGKQMFFCTACVQVIQQAYAISVRIAEGNDKAGG